MDNNNFISEGKAKFMILQYRFNKSSITNNQTI